MTAVGNIYSLNRNIILNNEKFLQMGIVYEIFSSVLRGGGQSMKPRSPACESCKHSQAFRNHSEGSGFRGEQQMKGGMKFLSKNFLSYPKKVKTPHSEYYYYSL